MLDYYGWVYFPKDFCITHSGYDKGSTQEFGELLRVAGPFAEPASLAYYFSGYLFFSWQRYRQLPTVLSMGLVLLCLFCLAVSTSTTARSEEHTSELQSLMRISYAVFCLKNKTSQKHP